MNSASTEPAAQPCAINSPPVSMNSVSTESAAQPCAINSPPATMNSTLPEPAIQFVDIPLSPDSSVPDLNLKVPENDAASSTGSNKLFRAPNRRFESRWHAVRCADQDLVKKALAILATVVLGSVLVCLVFFISTGASIKGQKTNKTGKMSHGKFVAVH